MTYVHHFCSIVASVDSGLVRAGIRVQLAAVDGNGGQDERPVCCFDKAAMLPLYYAFGALWVLC
jgi:hypothetical protein